MVNNIIDYVVNSDHSTSEAAQHKEARIQFQIRSQVTTNDHILLSKQPIRLVNERNEQRVDQLSSIENINLLNDHNLNEQMIKRSKLNNDELFGFLSTTTTKNDEQPQISSSVLSSYLANEVISNENQPNENQFLHCTTSTPTNVATSLDEFENSIELNESDCDHNQLNNCSFTNQTTGNSSSLQIDPFLSFLPYHHFASTTNTQAPTKSNNNSPTHLETTTGTCSSNTVEHTNISNQSSSNLSKMFLSSNQDTIKPSPSSTSTQQQALRTDNQSDDLFLRQFNGHSSCSNSPSDFMKSLDQDNEQIKLNSSSTMNSSGGASIGSSIESIDPINNEKRSFSSQKLNGEDLLFSLTSDDLNEVANYYLPFFSTELTGKDKFNCSPSLDSGDSMFCSSVWDSPPPSSTSSNNSSLNNDLDLPFILSSDSNELSSDKQTANEPSLLDSEFPFLSEDSMFDSFVNSNLNDLINTDEFFNEKCSMNDDLTFENNNLNGFLNDCSNFNNFNAFNSDHSTLPKVRKPLCTLSKDSSLAKLLREKLPVKSSPSSQSSSNQLANSSQNSNQKTDNHHHLKNGLMTTTTTKVKDDASSPSTVNNIVNNSSTNLNNSTSSSTPTKEGDLKENGLITRKFTIQSLNMTACAAAKVKNGLASTGCLPRSIKIIDPVGVTSGGGSVKYLVNSVVNTACTQNGQQSSGTVTTPTNSFSLNITPANCLTVTTNNSTTSAAGSLTNTTLNSAQLSGTTTGANLSTTKSFIIKSVDGKFANGILYTPISRNGHTTNIAYTSNCLSAVNSLSTGSTTATINTIANQTTLTTATADKSKIMAAFAPNSLFINNRKILQQQQAAAKNPQKRPYSSSSMSSMSVSISNNNNTNNSSQQTTKDLYSIDFVPKSQVTDTAGFISPTTTKDLCSEIKKKIKTLDTSRASTSKSYSTTKLPTNSVLLNLLLNGEDVSNGYLKKSNRTTYKQPLYKSPQQSTTRIA